MRKQHVSFTLLELLISLVLVGMLLTFFFTYFRQSLTSKNKAKILKEQVFKIETFQLRLHQIFSQYSKENKCSLSSLHHPDAVGAALLLNSDVGINIDPTFSGLLRSMLYKTRDHRLCLCTWSKNNSPKVDTLLDDIKEISFEFFSGKEWLPEWPEKKSAEAFPHMVKITVLLQETGSIKQEFIYSLPSNSKILYEVEVL